MIADIGARDDLPADGLHAHPVGESGTTQLYALSSNDLPRRFAVNVGLKSNGEIRDDRGIVVRIESPVKTSQPAAALVLAVILAMTACVPARVSPPRRTATSADAFVAVNGIRLHYTDWGGEGPSLLFLTPLGGDLHEQFDSLAPLFTDRFHVVGLTRRGQAPSAKPASGYDLDTLVRDIVAFLDARGIQRTHVAAHSVGGAEMTRLATIHPSRVGKLVYLDAVVDYRMLGQIAAEAGLPPPDDPALAAILREVGERAPDYTVIQAPALNIDIVYEGKIPVHPNDDTPAYRRYLQLVEERHFVEAQIDQFTREMARGETLILKDTTHGGFLADPEQQRVFVPRMKEFLLR